MKNVTMLLIVGTIFFLSCSDSENLAVPETVENPSQVTPESSSFSVTETKQPFVQLSDKGFEAMLVLLDIDGDNQINGKVSLEDLKKVTQLSTQNLTNSYWEKKSFIEKNYNEIPKIVSFDDVKFLSNLNILETYGGEHLDLSNNLKLEEIQLFVPAIKSINLKNLKKLRKLDLYPPSGVGYINHPNIQDFREIDLTDNISLEFLKYYGNASNLDLSKNVNLKELYLHSSKFDQSSLDLTKNTALEYLDCSALPSLKEVYISNETLDRINKFPENWKKPQGAIWKLKD